MKTRVVGSVAAAIALVGTAVVPVAVTDVTPTWVWGTVVVVVGALAVATRLLWSGASVATRMVFSVLPALVGGAATILAVYVAVAAAATHDICTPEGDGIPAVAWVVAAVLYVGIGVVGFQRWTWLPVAWPLAGLVAAGAVFALTLAFPPGHTSCLW